MGIEEKLMGRIEEKDNGQGNGSMVNWGQRFMDNRMHTKMHTNEIFKKLYIL